MKLHGSLIVVIMTEICGFKLEMFSIGVKIYESLALKIHIGIEIHFVFLNSIREIY